MTGNSLYTAVDHDDLIVLDPADDAYFCLPGAANDPGALQTLIRARGTASTGASVAGAAAPGEAATRDLYMVAGDAAPRVRPGDVAALLRAALVAAWQLRTQSPAAWLADAPTAPAREADVVAAALRFRRLAPLVPAMSRCLPNTLMLLALLRGAGIRARCVFAARTHPFEAHCWAQWRDIVLNDSLTHSRWYVPFG